MKSLVVYYSRSGNTKRVAVAISRVLGSDIEEIVDTKDRSGLIGWLSAGRDAFLKEPAVIKKMKMNPSKYKVIIIGTPTWSFTITPAIRAYIAKYGRRFRKVAFFCTNDGTSPKRIFRTMEELCGKKPLASLHVLKRGVKSGIYYEKVKKYTRSIKHKAR